MPNPIERWLLKRKPPEARTHFATEATNAILRSVLSHCTVCGSTLDRHTHRFFSTHPADDNPAADSFRAAVECGDWATVHLKQLPAVNRAIYVVYVIACPQAGGMVAMLLADPSGSDTLIFERPVSAEEFTTLRAFCPTCRWMPFGTSLQSGEEIV